MDLPKSPAPKKLQTIFMHRYAVDSTIRNNAGGNPPDPSYSTPMCVDFGLVKSKDDQISTHVPSSSDSPTGIDISDAEDDSTANSWSGNPPSHENNRWSQVNLPAVKEEGLAVTETPQPIIMATEETLSSPTLVNPKTDSVKESCQICGDTSIGFYWGAFVCEACKKFYSRSCKRSSGAYICTNRSSKNSCLVRKATRTACPYCRFKKCLSIGMETPGKGLLDTHNVNQLTCRVCGSPSSGFNFGVLTCEGCKGFFRRRTQNGTCKPELLVCQADGNCPINKMSRSQCRACRLQKCFRVGMSKQASRIGRLPNNIRYERIMKNRSFEAEPQACINSIENQDAQSEGLGLPTSSQCLSQTQCSASFSSLSPDASQPSPSQSSLSQSSPSQLSPSQSYYTEVEKSEHPMDLSLNCSKLLDLSRKIQQPLSSMHRIERLASVYDSTRQEYYRIVTDDEMLKPGISDETFTQLIYYDSFQGSLLLFVNFFKKVQGFMQLPLEDRVLLTKCSIYRLFLQAAAQRYDIKTGHHYMFGWKSWKGAPDRLVSLYPEYEVLVRHFKYFGREIKEFACSNEELGLLAVLNTINKDNLGDLKDQQGVTRLYNEYMELLDINTQANHADPAKRMQELTTVLALCRQAAKEHAAAAKNVINKYPSYAATAAHSAEMIPQLYKEMFSSTPWEHGDIS